MKSLPNIKRPCCGCPFRKDTLKGWLGERRMTEVLKADTFVCHKDTNKQCVGHMLIKGVSNSFVRLANKIGYKLDLSGNELVFNDYQSCIKHHSNR